MLEDAVYLHKDQMSNNSIGRHCGIVQGGFSQCFDYATEPSRRLKEACKANGKIWGEEIGLINFGGTPETQGQGQVHAETPQWGFRLSSW